MGWVELDQLHLYICVVFYSNSFMMASIYLCSNLEEGEYDFDAHLVLTHDTYVYLKEHNFHVDGLDYFMNHMEEEILKYNSCNLKKYNRSI